MGEWFDGEIAEKIHTPITYVKIQIKKMHVIEDIFKVAGSPVQNLT